MAIPGHFPDEGWVFVALDSEDFEDSSSISVPTQTLFSTSSLLYQETIAPAKSKPSILSTNLSKKIASF